MASSRSLGLEVSDVSISVQDYSLERPRGSTPPVQSSFWAVFSDMRGSLWIVGGLVHTWEAFFGCLIAIASTLLCYFFEFQNDTSAVSTILGVVIVFPITALIGFAFSRREGARGVLLDYWATPRLCSAPPAPGKNSRTASGGA